MDEELALWSFHFTKNSRNECIVQIVGGVPNESPLRDVMTGHDRGSHGCGSFSEGCAQIVRPRSAAGGNSSWREQSERSFYQQYTYLQKMGELSFCYNET